MNNAGHAVFKPALDTTLAEFQRTLDVNLTGPFLMVKAAVPLMRERSSIVNITSISGLRASALRIAYGTSKAALDHLTKQLALELSVRGIRVNAVAPGPVDTAMAKAVHSPAIRADYHDAIPLGRYGLEEELAEAIFFLSSERASYITGQTLAVDGGFDAIGIGLPTFRKDQGGSPGSAKARLARLRRAMRAQLSSRIPEPARDARGVQSSSCRATPCARDRSAAARPRTPTNTRRGAG